MNIGTAQKSLQNNPAETQKVFARLAASMEEVCLKLVGEFADEGYAPGEVAWILGQVQLASATAVHIQGGVPLETLLTHIRSNWAKNQEHLQRALAENGGG